MEAKLDAKMDSLKEEIMEVLKNFVTEKTPESENAPCYHSKSLPLTVKGMSLVT